MPSCRWPSRCSRSATPASVSRSTEPCSRTPARTRRSTYSRLFASMTTDSIPRRCSRCDSINPAGPAPTIATCVRIASMATTLRPRRLAAAVPGVVGSTWPRPAGRPDMTHDSPPTSTRSGPPLTQYRRDDVDVHPPLAYPDYRGTVLRAPPQPLVVLPQRLTEVTGPLLGEERVGDLDHDLTRQHAAEPIGQRIVVHAQVLDGDGRPVPHTLIEIWQANAAGRYRHAVDTWPAPLDPNFDGAGRALTDAEGRYRFVTVKPGAYPWKNHDNAWRPAHIHFSLFGRAFAQRLVTQMYF